MKIIALIAMLLAFSPALNTATQNKKEIKPKGGAADLDAFMQSFPY